MVQGRCSEKKHIANYSNMLTVKTLERHRTDTHSERPQNEGSPTDKRTEGAQKRTLTNTHTRTSHTHTHTGTHIHTHTLTQSHTHRTHTEMQAHQHTRDRRVTNQSPGSGRFPIYSDGRDGDRNKANMCDPELQPKQSLFRCPDRLRWRTQLTCRS